MLKERISNTFSKEKNENREKNVDRKILIKSSNIMAGFMGAFLWKREPVYLGDCFMLEDNRIYLLNNNRDCEVSIDLLTADISFEVTSVDLNNAFVYNMNNDSVVYSMGSVIVNALPQWIGATPYFGSKMCQLLSIESRRFLRPYKMKLNITTKGMKVYKSRKQITCAQAIYEIIESE